MSCTRAKRRKNAAEWKFVSPRPGPLAADTRQNNNDDDDNNKKKKNKKNKNKKNHRDVLTRKRKVIVEDLKQNQVTKCNEKLVWVKLVWLTWQVSKAGVACSYTWKKFGKPLNMDKTLAENGMEEPPAPGFVSCKCGCLLLSFAYFWIRYSKMNQVMMNDVST